MIKETLRASWLLLTAVWATCMMPRLVRESEGRQWRQAAALSLGAYNVAHIGFNCLHQACTRALLVAGIGVPVPVFYDLRAEAGGGEGGGEGGGGEGGGGEGGGGGGGGGLHQADTPPVSQQTCPESRHPRRQS